METYARANLLAKGVAKGRLCKENNKQVYTASLLIKFATFYSLLEIIFLQRRLFDRRVAKLYLFKHFSSQRLLRAVGV